MRNFNERKAIVRAAWMTIFMMVLVLMAFFFAAKARGQNIWAPTDIFEKRDIDPVVTDSIIWRTIDTLNIGNPKCKHQWVYSEETRSYGNIGCLVYHNGFHCSWDDKVRDRICRTCLRKEHQKEHWYQHYRAPETTEYEMLELQLNPPAEIKPDTLLPLSRYYVAPGKGIDIRVDSIITITNIDTLGKVLTWENNSLVWQKNPSSIKPVTSYSRQTMVDYSYPDIPKRIKERAWKYAEETYMYGCDPDEEEIGRAITDFFNGAMYMYQQLRKKK